MNEIGPVLREKIIEHLALLSSLEQQAAYARDVPIANVPAELFCVWFDDLDLPASAPMAFAGQDLETIRKFSETLTVSAVELGELSLAQLHARRSWLLLVEDARRVLEEVRDAV